MAKKTSQRQLEHHELTDWVEQATTAEEQQERAEHANAGYPVMVAEEVEVVDDRAANHEPGQPLPEDQAERAANGSGWQGEEITDAVELEVTPIPTTRKAPKRTKASRPSKVIALVTPVETPIVPPKAKKEPKEPPKPSSQAATVTEFIELKNRDFAKATKINMETSRGVEHWKREAWSLMQETLNDSMVHCVERLRMEESGIIAYRFGYYIVSKNGTWVRPMNTPMYYGDDYTLFYEKAKAEGTIL
jgi:hypothetical protein